MKNSEAESLGVQVGDRPTHVGIGTKVDETVDVRSMTVKEIVNVIAGMKISRKKKKKPLILTIRRTK